LRIYCTTVIIIRLICLLKLSFFANELICVFFFLFHFRGIGFLLCNWALSYIQHTWRIHIRRRPLSCVWRSSRGPRLIWSWSIRRRHTILRILIYLPRSIRKVSRRRYRRHKRRIVLIWRKPVWLWWASLTITELILIQILVILPANIV
jgi:hypothetical protein